MFMFMSSHSYGENSWHWGTWRDTYLDQWFVCLYGLSDGGLPGLVLLSLISAVICHSFHSSSSVQDGISALEKALICVSTRLSEVSSTLPLEQLQIEFKPLFNFYFFSYLYLNTFITENIWVAQFFLHGDLWPQKPYGLLGQGRVKNGIGNESPGLPPCSHSYWAVRCTKSQTDC